MKKYNDTTYAILGILTTDCKTGYAIKQLMDRSLTHFWKISYGQIYPALKLLVQDGLAEVVTATTEGKPDRQEYSLTPQGMAVLKDWLQHPIEQLPIERHETLLKLFFGSYQTDEQTQFMIENYKTKLEERHQTYLSIEHAIIHHSENEKDATYWLLTLDYGKRVNGAAIDWCDAALERLKT